jgi:hypothetical protein
MNGWCEKLYDRTNNASHSIKLAALVVLHSKAADFQDLFRFYRSGKLYSSGV